MRARLLPMTLTVTVHPSPTTKPRLRPRSHRAGGGRTYKTSRPSVFKPTRMPFSHRPYERDVTLAGWFLSNRPQEAQAESWLSSAGTSPCSDSFLNVALFPRQQGTGVKGQADTVVGGPHVDIRNEAVKERNASPGESEPPRLWRTSAALGVDQLQSDHPARQQRRRASAQCGTILVVHVCRSVTPDGAVMCPKS